MRTRKRSGVYQIVNEVNGKFYIGSSVNVDHRWSDWRYYVKNPGKLRYPSLLVKAFLKYGLEHFTFILLEECEPTKEALETLEQKYIDLLQPAYNVLPRAYSSIGHTMSESGRAAVSKAQAGRKRTPEQIDFLKNRLITDDTKAKMSAAKLGTTVPAEIRQKMSEAHKGKTRSEDHVRNNIESRHQNRLEKMKALTSTVTRPNDVRHTLRRLSDDDVRAIRSSDLMDSVICKQYNCSPPAIAKIRTRRTYRDVV